MSNPHRNALVTGASGDIGGAITSELAQQGFKVAAHYFRDRQAAESLVAALPGGPHTLVQGDLEEPNSAESIVETAAKALGGLSVLINNAGAGYAEHALLEVPFDVWRDTWTHSIATNLLGAAYVSFWAARHMAKVGGGRMVNISARGAFRGEPHAPAFGASKAGLNAMSQSLAQALAPHNIFVYVVAPGWVETSDNAEILGSPEGESIRRESPLGRVARPDEVARTVCFLASTAPEYLTGCIVDLNGASYLRS